MDTSTEQMRHYNGEISLVDLAAIFLKRRRVFYVVSILVTLGGLAYAFLAADKYEYVTLIKLAENASGEYAEMPETIIAELESFWVPDLRAAHHTENEQGLPFKITASNPKNTGLVRIVSEASTSAEELVSKSHQVLAERISSQQKLTIDKLRTRLQKQIESLSGTIEMLEGGQETGEAIAASVEKQLSLEADLEALESAEVLVISRRSSESIGPARIVIVVLAGLMGSISGVLLAFFAEFIGLVREKASGL